MTEFPTNEESSYEIQQIGKAGQVLTSQTVLAHSGEAAARQLRDVVDGADKILVYRDGARMNEMRVGFWKKRVRRR